jgi:hypothetical protein
MSLVAFIPPLFYFYRGLSYPYLDVLLLPIITQIVQNVNTSGAVSGNIAGNSSVLPLFLLDNCRQLSDYYSLLGIA